MKNKIDKDDSLSGLSKRILYLYIQAFLFNDSGLGLEDRELKKYTTKDIEITESKVNKFPWTKVRACIDELEEQGVLIKTQKSPLTRKLSSDYISNVIISDEQ
ncbi:hypothetical protein [Latilactobacillus sakei]|uniref:hypothetical protein n=1 Tax=Latilactobacillus sakei TaxID=1599 RepID=UPI0012FF191C|nr:hypothetical protein [Latilactobacillus sakei]